LLVVPEGLALIDWGTPSFGPFMYDLATWMNFASNSAESRTMTAQALRDAYFAAGPCDDGEAARLDDFSRLWGWLAGRPPLLNLAD
jgi:Ser/Thr protein kinase RdoA (MazF antagonist)